MYILAFVEKITETQSSRVLPRVHQVVVAQKKEKGYIVAKVHACKATDLTIDPLKTIT